MYDEDVTKMSKNDIKKQLDQIRGFLKYFYDRRNNREAKLMSIPEIQKLINFKRHIQDIFNSNFDIEEKVFFVNKVLEDIKKNGYNIFFEKEINKENYDELINKLISTLCKKVEYLLKDKDNPIENERIKLANERKNEFII